jgi:hypothetical protein
VGHALFMDIFSSAVLFDDTVNCCGTGRPNRRETPKIFLQKMKLKYGDIKTEVRVA